MSRLYAIAVAVVVAVAAGVWLAVQVVDALHKVAGGLS